MVRLPSITMTVPMICLWSLLWTCSLSSGAHRGEGVHTTPRSDLMKGSCYSQCDTRFLSSKTEPWLACHHGCRLRSLLGQVAGTKSRKDVRQSCFAACTEAYNVTAQEKACQSGCGEQVRGKKNKKPSPERHVSVAKNKPTGTVTTVPPNLPAPNIRFLWSKSVVDEQDSDSSSEDQSQVHSSLLPFKSNPFPDLSSIWQSSLLPQSIKITKSIITYVSSESLPSAPATSSQTTGSTVPLLSATDFLKELTDGASATKDETIITPKPDTDAKVVVDRHVVRYLAEGGQIMNGTVLSWKPGVHGIGRLDILIFFIGLSFFVVFLTLFRAVMTDKSYLPLSVSVMKKDATGLGQLASSDDEADSGDELLVGVRSQLVLSGMLPPTYEEAQQHLRPAAHRPLLVSLDVPAPNNLSC